MRFSRDLEEISIVPTSSIRLSTTGALTNEEGVYFPLGPALCGGIYIDENGVVHPIPNGVMHEGQIATSAVMTLRQYAALATPEIGDVLNTAASELANKLNVPISAFLKTIGNKIP